MSKILLNKIKKLKTEKNAFIAAHIYQPPEIQEMADYVSDSLDLAKIVRQTKAEIILFCGVKFMAETAKILAPDKKILACDLTATCPMAHMVTEKEIKELKKKYPQASVVTYVNSTTTLKALADFCCTSANAKKIIAQIKTSEIIFAPDQNLGKYLESQFLDKKFILTSGYCPCHHHISLASLQKKQKAHPEAKILAHPECPPAILNQADFIGSTTQIINFAAQDFDPKTFLIATEKGTLHALHQKAPQHQFVLADDQLICPDMKKTSLLKVYETLLKENSAIEVDQVSAQKAIQAIENMFSLT